MLAKLRFFFIPLYVLFLQEVLLKTTCSVPLYKQTHLNKRPCAWLLNQVVNLV